MLNLQNEISREAPIEAGLLNYANGNPILYAFDCALLERETEKSFTYAAFNLKTGKAEILGRRRTPLAATGVEKMVEKLRMSRVAGVGKLQADRPAREQINIKKAREILKAVFKKYLHSTDSPPVTNRRRLPDTYLMK